jgi:hypothetical protein
VQVVRQGPSLEPSPHLLLARLARACEQLDLLGALDRYHHGSVAVEREDVPRPDLRSADANGHVELAYRILRRSASAHEPSPDGQAKLLELLEVADGAVDEQARDTAYGCLGREQLADERDGLRLGQGEYEYLARPRGCDERVNHEVVSLPAEGSARRPRDAAPTHDLDEWGVDEPGSSGSLVNRGDPEPGKDIDVGALQSDITTCGMARWKASA